MKNNTLSCTLNIYENNACKKWPWQDIVSILVGNNKIAKLTLIYRQNMLFYCQRRRVKCTFSIIEIKLAL